MEIILFFLFFVFYLGITTHLRMIAVHQSMGLVPYPFGTTIFCFITHISILVTCIWHFGWLVGILLFALELIGLVHSTFGWLIVLPGMIKSTPPTQARIEVAFLFPAMILSVIFCIISFIFTEYSLSLDIFVDLFEEYAHVFIAIFSAAIILFFVRINVIRKLQ